MQYSKIGINRYCSKERDCCCSHSEWNVVQLDQPSKKYGISNVLPGNSQCHLTKPNCIQYEIKVFVTLIWNLFFCWRCFHFWYYIHEYQWWRSVKSIHVFYIYILFPTSAVHMQATNCWGWEVKVKPFKRRIHACQFESGPMRHSIGFRSSYQVEVIYWCIKSMVTNKRAVSSLVEPLYPVDILECVLLPSE